MKQSGLAVKRKVSRQLVESAEEMKRLARGEQLAARYLGGHLQKNSLGIIEVILERPVPL